MAERALSAVEQISAAEALHLEAALTRKASGQRTLALRFLTRQEPPALAASIARLREGTADQQRAADELAAPTGTATRWTRSSTRRRRVPSYAPPTGRHPGAPRCRSSPTPTPGWPPTCSTSSTPWASTSSVTPGPRSWCTTSRSPWAPCTGSRGERRRSAAAGGVRGVVGGDRRVAHRRRPGSLAAGGLPAQRERHLGGRAVPGHHRQGQVAEERTGGADLPGQVVEALARTSLRASWVDPYLHAVRDVASALHGAAARPVAAHEARGEKVRTTQWGQRDDVDCRDAMDALQSTRWIDLHRRGLLTPVQLEEVWATLRWLDEPEGSFDPVDGTYVAGNLREPGVYAGVPSTCRPLVPQAPARRHRGVGVRRRHRHPRRPDRLDPRRLTPPRARPAVPGDPTPAARVDPAR